MKLTKQQALDKIEELKKYVAKEDKKETSNRRLMIDERRHLLEGVIDYISHDQGWEESGDIYRKHYGLPIKYPNLVYPNLVEQERKGVCHNPTHEFVCVGCGGTGHLIKKDELTTEQWKSGDVEIKGGPDGFGYSGYFITVKDEFTNNTLAVTKKELEKIILYAQAILK